MTLLSGILVLMTGLYLVGLAVLAVVAPSRASRFLTGFASSARAHYLEQVLRLVAGAALIVFAPEMRFAVFFTVFGWILTLTSVGLLLVPWQWHHRFGEWAIPFAIRHIKLYALGALLLGAFILYAALSGARFGGVFG